MQRKFVSSLLLLLLVNVLIKPLWIFGVDLQVQNQVGAEAYGLYSAIFSFALIFNILLDFGLSHQSNRRIAQNPGALARHFSGLIGLKLLLGLVYFAVALVLGYFLGYGQAHAPLLLLLAASQFLSSMVLFLRSHLAGLQLFQQDALMSVLDKSLLILSCGWVLYGGGPPMSIGLFAALQAASYALAALVGLALVLRQTGAIRLRFEWPRFAFRLSQGLPYALLILLMAFYTRVDSVMIQQLRGSFENGIYAQAFRLLDALNQPGYLFSVLLLPLFAGMLARRESVEGLSRLAFSLIMILTVSLSAAAFAQAEALMEALYHEESQRSSPVFRVLILSAIAFGTTYVFGTLLTARGHLRLLNRIAGLGFAVNILANFIFIPRYGALGAAWSTLITQGITALVQMIWALRSESLRYSRGYWLRLSLWLLWSALLTGVLAPQIALAWWQTFALLALSISASALVFGLLPWREAWGLLRQKLIKA